MSPQDRGKAAAAKAAVAEVSDGMLVGLGTGSTAAFAIAALGRRTEEGLRVRACATSLASERAAVAAGIAVVPFDEIAAVDLAIDGADEIDPGLRAIKGGGGALLREKIVAASAARMICIVDGTKPVPVLRRPLPVELLPFARSFVSQALEKLGGTPVLRRDTAGAPARTDQGNLLIDCDFGPIAEPEELAERLQAIPGLLGHGLFLSEIDVLMIGSAEGVERRERD